MDVNVLVLMIFEDQDDIIVVKMIYVEYDVVEVLWMLWFVIDMLKEFDLYL